MYPELIKKSQRIKKLEPAEGSLLRSSLIYRVLDDLEHIGFDCPEDAAYLCLVLVIGAADTVRVLVVSLPIIVLIRANRVASLPGHFSRLC